MYFIHKELCKYCRKQKHNMLMVSMFVLGFLGLMFAPGKQVAAAAFNGGDGSAQNPYQVATPAQLNEIRNYSGKYFVLMKDIDLASDRKTREWQPIAKFRGQIEGNGHTIKNLSVNQQGSKAGFIATGDRASIYNVKFENVNVNGLYAGAIIAEINHTDDIRAIVTVKNCSVTGVVTGSNNTGGIIGRSEAKVSISNCNVKADITGDCTGGIIGAFSEGSITGCKVQGTVGSTSTSYTAVGGIAGSIYAGGMTNGYQEPVVSNCNVDASVGGEMSNAGGIAGQISLGLVKGCTVSGSVQAFEYAGGIIGMSIDAWGGATVENNVNRANVSISGSRYSEGFAGGIVGGMADTQLVDCSNYGTVTGKRYAGGVTGYLGNGGVIKNSKNYGSVNADKTSLYETVSGGIFGQVYADTAEVQHSISYGTVEGKKVGSIGGEIKRKVSLSSCYYIADQTPIAIGSSTGAVRIGEAANPVLKLGSLQSIQSRYPGEVTIVPMSSEDSGIIEIKDGKLYGAAVGTTKVTSNVTIMVKGEASSYTITEAFQVTEEGVFAGGEGTKEHPYQIKTAEQLQLAASYPNAHYVLENDIDVYEINSFSPIGTYENPFTGSFDGNEYVIKGLTVTSYAKSAGLFGAAYNATINGVYLEDAYITTGKYAGGIVGYAYCTEISDCIVNGEISATTIAKNHSGLVVGYMDGGSLKNCCGVGEVKAAYAGVFAGYSNIIASNCYWYTPYNTEGIAQGTSQSVNAAKKIDLGIGKLKIGEEVTGTLQARALQPTTNFKLYGTPTKYVYTNSSNTKVAKISNGKIVPVAAGTANIQLSVAFANGKSVPMSYKVEVAKAIQTVTVSAIKTQTFTNKEIKPAITVMDGNKKLTANDYTVSYQDNKNPGKATIVITGKGSYSGTKKVYFTIAIPKAGGLKYTNKTNQISLTWNKVTGVDGYEVYDVATKKSVAVTKTSYTKSKLKDGTVYQYKVRAYKIVNKKKVYGSYSNVITTVTKPAIPTVKLTAGSKKVTVAWNKVKNANGYEVYMATSSKGKYTKIQQLTKNSKTSYVKTKLTKKKTYYFKVRSYKTVDGKKIYSDYSSVKKIKVK